MKGGKHRRRPPPQGVRRAGCFAHVRRKFEKIWKDSGQKCETSHEFLLLIANLYAVESQARTSDLTGKDYDAMRLALRQERSIAPMAKLKPIFDSLGGIFRVFPV